MAVRRATKPKKRCQHCGKKFTPNRSDHIYCSKSCKVGAWRDRQACFHVLEAFGINIGLGG